MTDPAPPPSDPDLPPVAHYEPIAVSDESTVVAAYEPAKRTDTGYQSEADLERELIAQLQRQAYGYLRVTSEDDLVANLRAQLQALNRVEFSDAEWQRFLTTSIASANEGIREKTARIQEDNVQVLVRDDGTSKNIRLIDKEHVHNNRLQVLNQYETDGDAATHATRYDVTILVNGLPLVHIELKRRGVAIREAFNQIDRYQRESFWAGSGLFEYVQLFVISNGTHTKYYSNTTRRGHLDETARGRGRRRRTSNSFEFTSWWADAANHRIADLVDFTKTFLSKHTLLNLLTRYCVFDVDRKLLVMRPYQIAAAERILQRIVTSTNARRLGTRAAGGYVWHTTGSGKTLTSFKAAQLASRLESVDKVLFVVDRKDLDYQTMREYERFQKGAANSNTSTAVLARQLGDPDARIIITTIQKLARFVAGHRDHAVYDGHVVIIFDECHRSQFGDMHTAITKAFRRYNLFGFTGTPIFAANAGSGGNPQLRTTEQAFGDRLHGYTIVDAIGDGNVLPFRIDYVNTIRARAGMTDAQVSGIDRERALLAPERIRQVVGYTLDHFTQKTRRTTPYRLGDAVVSGFNAIFATASIDAARRYYAEFARQQTERAEADAVYKPLKIATIFSHAPNEDVEGLLAEEGFETDALDASSREFLDAAIADYNRMFATSFDTSADRFQNYYRDLAMRLRSREVDMVIVVNMFLTGFDATTLNTLWVDKGLRQHGLLQAYSRTNRILNSVKTYGNIVSFRDLEQETNDALALFGNRDAAGVVLLKPYAEYHAQYREHVDELVKDFPAGQAILGEEAERRFIRLFGVILRLQNVLMSFDEFTGDEILTEREFQDYRSMYLDLWQERRRDREADREPINDDLEFEIELIKQVEVNVDYVLMLVERFRAAKGDGTDRELEVYMEIGRAVDSSHSLRNKRDLIMDFVKSVSTSPDVRDDWRRFVAERRERELDELVAEENLNADAARAFVAGALRDGDLPTTGTAITRVLPPASRFSPEGEHEARKQRVMDRLRAFFDRFSGLG